MKLSLTNGRLNRQQLVEWLLNMNYFVSATAMAELHILNEINLNSELSELCQNVQDLNLASDSNACHFRKYHGDVLRMPGVTFDSPVAHKQIIHILSDAAYELAEDAITAYRGLHTQFREQDFERLCGISRSLPKELRTYQRGDFCKPSKSRARLPTGELLNLESPIWSDNSKIAVRVDANRAATRTPYRYSVLHCVSLEARTKYKNPSNCARTIWIIAKTGTKVG